MFVEDIPRQIFSLCNSGGCRTRGMSWKKGAWGDARLGASGSAKKRSRENDMGILCLNIARWSARVDAEGLQFLRISSIRVAERKEGGSKTSPGRGSRRRCPKWNSPRLLHVLHIFHCVQYFDPSCTFLPCVQFTYQIMMLLARPSGCNLASLPVFKEGEGEGQVIWAMPERKRSFLWDVFL